MGNQGMTNWKFSAFFAIALILVAGMFASTADRSGRRRLGQHSLLRIGDDVAEKTRFWRQCNS